MSGQLETVKAYKTSDGEIFEDDVAAYDHQANIDFNAWYEDNQLMGNYAGSYVDLSTLKEWLKDNSTQVNRLMKAL